MINATYHIRMKTQLGNKYGQICLHEKDNFLWGTFDILGHKNSIHGEILQNGKCHFSGELVTPIRIIAFSAEGDVDESSITLVIYTDRFIMSVSGENNDLNIENETKR